MASAPQNVEHRAVWVEIKRWGVQIYTAREWREGKCTDGYVETSKFGRIKATRLTKVDELMLVRLDNVFSAERCADLIKAAEEKTGNPLWQQSAVSGTSSEDFRTSTTAMRASISQEHPLSKDLEALMAEMTGISNLSCAGLTRYKHRQKFDLHPDARFPDLMRRYTFLLYLNTLAADEGGGTWFPSAASSSITVQPVTGSILWWRNFTTDTSSTTDPRSKHAGLPVLSATAQKYVINCWVVD